MKRSMERWWNYTEEGKLNYSKKNLLGMKN
jgi:hypothetical protein